MLRLGVERLPAEVSTSGRGDGVPELPCHHAHTTGRAAGPAGWGLHVWGQLSGSSLGWGPTLGRGQSLLLLARPFLAAPLAV